jgi:hypothetical protein
VLVVVAPPPTLSSLAGRDTDSPLSAKGCATSSMPWPAEPWLSPRRASSHRVTVGAG